MLLVAMQRARAPTLRCVRAAPQRSGLAERQHWSASSRKWCGAHRCCSLPVAQHRVSRTPRAATVQQQRGLQRSARREGRRSTTQALEETGCSSTRPAPQAEARVERLEAATPSRNSWRQQQREQMKAVFVRLQPRRPRQRHRCQQVIVQHKAQQLC